MNHPMFVNCPGKNCFENIDEYKLECEQKLSWVIKLEVPILKIIKYSAFINYAKPLH